MYKIRKSKNCLNQKVYTLYKDDSPPLGSCESLSEVKKWKKQAEGNDKLNAMLLKDSTLSSLRKKQRCFGELEKKYNIMANQRHTLLVSTYAKKHTHS